MLLSQLRREMEIIQLLLKLLHTEASPFLTSGNYRTVLQAAAYQNHEEVLTRLSGIGGRH